MKTLSSNSEKNIYILFLFSLALLIGNNLSAQCPVDFQPSCPSVTNVIMTESDNGNGTSDYTITIDWAKGTANNASFQWDVYSGTLICPEDYTFPGANCIHVHAGNAGGTVVEVLSNVPHGNLIFMSSQGRTNASCGGNECNQVFSQIVLPVSFVEIVVNGEENGNLISWTTKEEIYNDGFEIEHQQEGKNTWTQVGFIEGTNVQGISDYHFLHRTTSPGIHYYRIRQVDTDGAATYSDIISTSRGNSDTRIFPNPVKLGDDIIIHSIASDQIDIIDQLGRMIKRIDTSELSETSINTSEFTSGLYYLRMSNSGEVTSIVIE